MNKLVSPLFLLLLAACGSQPPRPEAEGTTGTAPGAVSPTPTFSAQRATSLAKQGGGFYLDDGPLDHSIDLSAIPDAQPKAEPLHRFANRPYTALGRTYVPLASAAGYRERGIASWYGRRYHGQKTASGEPYDMFAMTAAHPTLPIPSYARVTRLDAGAYAGKSVVVRINDRGPFLHGRLIDLSYVAAWKLGLIEDGSGTVLVETVLPDALPAAASEAPTRQTPAPAENPQLEDVQERSGHYLQLGAFASRDNAESLKAKLCLDLGELGDKLVVRSSGSLHRLQLGPWVDIAEARRIAERLKSAFGLESVLVR